MLILFFVIIGGVLVFKWSAMGSSVIWSLSNEGKWMLPLVAVSALIDSINPCAFSILLLTIAFLIGIGRTRADILMVGLFYIAGLFAVYLLIGLGILQALHLFDTPHFMGKVGAALLITLGVINLINYLFPAFPIKLRIPVSAHHKMAKLIERASLPTAFGLGLLVGLCEFPCTGGPYLMILGLLHDWTTYWRGVLYLVFYNLIFVLPLVVILALAAERSFLSKLEMWQRENKVGMRLWGGLAMVALGLIILFF